MPQIQQKNMKTALSKRPPDGNCTTCQAPLQPYLRPAVLGLPERWIPAGTHCAGCLEKQRVETDAIAEQQRLDEAFRSSRLAPRFLLRTAAQFRPTKGTQHAYDVACNYRVTEGGLLFFGPCGVGKTHLAACIAQHHIGKVPTLFISCPELLMEIRNAIRQGQNERKTQLLQLAMRVSLLVLDDIGAEKVSEWVQETLFVLVNYRYEHMLSTIFTTNCSMDELEGKLGQRITSRMIEMCRCIRLQGNDWRLKKRKEWRHGTGQ